ncbi:MAG: hypothetical protein Q7U68_02985, partial [Candidatus Roizmanbacteria bacterium]|nr:hypothetical protein [Candidatus Roizmanbacteria bacterium]
MRARKSAMRSSIVDIFDRTRTIAKRSSAHMPRKPFTVAWWRSSDAFVLNALFQMVVVLMESCFPK